MNKQISKRVQLTIDVVEAAKQPETGQTFIWDLEMPGFGLRLTRGSKTFVAQKLVKGERTATRVSIGRWPQMKPDKARKEAQTHLSNMSLGENPNDRSSVPLAEAFNAYMKMKQAKLKPRTIKDYKEVFNYIPDWHKKHITEITKDMVERRHKNLGEERGAARANYVMRVLRAVLNYARGKYEIKGQPVLQSNPVEWLSINETWFKVEGRTDYVKADELPQLFTALEKISNETMRDYFTLIIFTGLRRMEAAKLRWENVDLTAKTIAITDTKNGKRLDLPLSDHLLELLKRRKENANGNEWVFSGEGQSGHLADPKRQLEFLRKTSGLTFSIHGLRRTFVTIAESLDLSEFAIKRLVNHTPSGSDGNMTLRYTMRDVERLREPVQRIATFILAKAGQTQGAKVIPMKRGKGL